MSVWLTDSSPRDVYLDGPGKVGKTFSFLPDDAEIGADVLLGISDTP